MQAIPILMTVFLFFFLFLRLSFSLPLPSPLFFSSIEAESYQCCSYWFGEDCCISYPHNMHHPRRPSRVGAARRGEGAAAAGEGARRRCAPGGGEKAGERDGVACADEEGEEERGRERGGE